MMILVSGALHALLLLVAVLLPKAWLNRSPQPLVSYTVDLIAPDKLGGSNMIQGGKGRVQAPPMAAVAPPKAAELKTESAKAPPPEPAVVKPEPAKIEPPKPELEKVAAVERKIEVKEEARPIERKVEPKVPDPKPVEEKAERKVDKSEEIALANKAERPSPVPTKPKAIPSADTMVSPKAVARTEATKQSTVTPKATVNTVAEAREAAVAKASAEAKAAADAKAAAEAKALAEKVAAEKAVSEKAAAEKEAAEKAARESAERDSQIAAAIRRVEQKGERGGGLGSTPAAETGGPLGSGPGEGIGGQVMGVEFLMYRNLVTKKIQDSWAWAGTNQALEATVRFSITEAGDIVDVRIEKSSGDKGFDTSAERAVRAANPLPPPPEQYRKEFADFILDFDPRDLKM